MRGVASDKRVGGENFTLIFLLLLSVLEKHFHSLQVVPAGKVNCCERKARSSLDWKEKSFPFVD